MPHLCRLFMIGALLLSVASAAPIITADAFYAFEVSDTYAEAFGSRVDYDYWDEYDYYFVHYELGAVGTPYWVSASAGSWLEDGYSSSVPDWGFEWAETTVVGELKIVGGSGMAYVDFLVSLNDACAGFSPLGVDHWQCGYTPPNELLAIPFRFNDPFSYEMQAYAQLPEGGVSSAQLNGIVVRDAAGRVLSGAQLVPGDFPVPDDAVPEPSTWLLAAAGCAFMAWRSRRDR